MSKLAWRTCCLLEHMSERHDVCAGLLGMISEYPLRARSSVKSVRVYTCALKKEQQLTHQGTLHNVPGNLVFVPNSVYNILCAGL